MRWLPLLIFVSCAAPSGPTFTSIEPATVDAQNGAAVTLRGAQWLPPATFNFDKPEDSKLEAATVSAFLFFDGGTRVDLTGVKWVDATQITATVPPLDEGVYDVHLIEPRGTELVLPAALSAEQCFGGDCADAGPCAQSNYRDFDLDGYGAGNPVMRCGVGYASRAGDCDSFDDQTHPGAPELCNGIDDDCDGVVDAPNCSGWSLAADAGPDLLFASAVSADQLWAASASSVFSGNTAFTEVAPGCVAGIAAIAAQSTGQLEVVTQGHVTRFDPPLACVASRTITGSVVSLLNFGVQFVGVSSTGDVWRWAADGMPSVTPTNLGANAIITAAHGISPTQLLAVGTLDGAPRAWMLGADGTWVLEPALPRNTDRLTSVWMLSPTNAVITGDNGTLVLRYWRGWYNARRGNTRDDFTSVRAFSLSRIYVTTAEGLVRQRAGNAWRTVFTAPTPLNALTGMTEEGLWAVGNRGVVVRGSR